MIEIKEIEKTFAEAENALGILMQEALEHWKDNPSDQEENIKIRLTHLFDVSQPTPNDGAKLSYSFYELQEMLKKVVSKLPSFFNEKAEVDEKLLTLLTNFLAGVERLKNGEKKQTTIPADENSSYWLVSLSEKKRLENDFAQERLKSFQLKKKLDSLEADWKNKILKIKEIGQQIGSKASEIKNKLASIGYDYSELSEKELNNYLNELQEMSEINSSINTSIKFFLR